MAKLIYQIVEVGPEWADKYRVFCRYAYLRAYTRPDLGINEDQFSEEVFNSSRVKKYFKDILTASDKQKAWLAIDDNDEILGGVVACKRDGYCEMGSFYVRPDLKGRGIGHALYQKVLEYAGHLPIQVDVLKYMRDTIDMYRHWGFEIDESKGEVTYDWIEWPEHAKKAYRAIYMVKPGQQRR